MMQAWENPLHLEGYTLGEEIGRGASGTVYSAKSIANGRTYAAKKLAIEDTSIREIGVLIQLKKHPNIMEFTESKLGRDGETQVLFVITEFCPLGNIGDYILQQQVDIVTKKNLAVQMADAITFLHKNGIVHRDIKPQNVLLAGNEAHLVLKVVDFGLAKLLTSSENSVNNISRSYMRSAVGTRFYLSPEIYQSLPNDQPCGYTPSVDIFSIGLLLWAMFDGLSIPGSCGEDRYLTPFTRSETDPMPVAQAITQGDVELNVMEREENVRCKNLVCRMLSRDPKERPEAEEVLQTLIRGYGDYRLSQGVVRVVVDDDCSTCSCTRTDPSCPNLNCLKFWKGNDDDVNPGCLSCSCSRTDTNGLPPCLCTGTNPSSASCSCCDKCKNSSCLKFWKGNDDGVSMYTNSSQCSCIGTDCTCSCTGILRRISCVLCYLDKNQQCGVCCKKGILMGLLVAIMNVFILLIQTVFIAVIVIIIIIMIIYMLIGSCFECICKVECPEPDILEKMIKPLGEEGPVAMCCIRSPTQIHDACPSLCRCLSPQSDWFQYEFEYPDVECCNNHHIITAANLDEYMNT
ncbi:uncharacterized protein LOC144920460 [Branchiostoma floridae x Branchiostoma belcheri]